MALQPISIQLETGLAIATGFERMDLRPGM
jgi:hypothetical protein